MSFPELDIQLRGMPDGAWFPVRAGELRQLLAMARGAQKMRAILSKARRQHTESCASNGRDCICDAAVHNAEIGELLR